jgi:hypothetical protein
MRQGRIDSWTAPLKITALLSKTDLFLPALTTITIPIPTI